MYTVHCTTVYNNTVARAVSEWETRREKLHWIKVKKYVCIFICIAVCDGSGEGTAHRERLLGRSLFSKICVTCVNVWIKLENAGYSQCDSQLLNANYKLRSRWEFHRNFNPSRANFDKNWQRHHWVSTRNKENEIWAELPKKWVRSIEFSALNAFFFGNFATILVFVSSRTDWLWVVAPRVILEPHFNID